MGDLEAIHAIMRDPQAMAYWSTPPHCDTQQTREWLSAMIAIDPHEGEDFVVQLDGAVIGKAGLFRFPEIGFIFHPHIWGRGLAREALRAVLGRAFARHGLSAVEADVDPRNKACLRLLSHLGFVETGQAKNTWLVGERWCDSVYLSLSNGGWASTGKAQKPA